MINKRSQNFACRQFKKYLSLTAILSPIILAMGCFLSDNYTEYVHSSIKPKRIRGIVISKSKEETGCYGLIILKQNQEVDTLRQIYYCTPPENAVWRYVESGDSILKEAGTLEVFVKRNGATVKFIFANRIPL
jgi:hypothetical protein